MLAGTSIAFKVPFYENIMDPPTADWSFFLFPCYFFLKPIQREGQGQAVSVFHLAIMLLHIPNLI